MVVELTTEYLFACCMTIGIKSWYCDNFSSFEDNSNIYLTILSSCHNQVGHKDLIELFCKLDLSAYHQDISECFESAAFEAIDHLLKVSHYTPEE